MKKEILSLMEQFDELSDKDYELFSLAFCLWCRSDIEEIKNISEKKLFKINDYVIGFDSLLNEDLRDAIDYELRGEE